MIVAKNRKPLLTNLKEPAMRHSCNKSYQHLLNQSALHRNKKRREGSRWWWWKGKIGGDERVRE